RITKAMLTTKVRTQTLIRMILPPGRLPVLIRIGKAPRTAEWGFERNGATNRACRPFSDVWEREAPSPARHRPRNHPSPQKVRRFVLFRKLFQDHRSSFSPRSFLTTGQGVDGAT